MQNTYSSFQSASDSNWDLLQEIFGNSKQFKLIRPSYNKSVFDGILTAEKNGKRINILVEVKRRQFTVYTLQNEYNNTLFLEKEKYKYLHKRRDEFQKGHPGESFKIWYLSKTTDGVIFIHDITDKDFSWVSVRMNSITYEEHQQKKMKMVALLNTADALFAQKTNILK